MSLKTIKEEIKKSKLDRLTKEMEESGVKFASVYEAYSFLNDSVYFARPFYDKKGELYSFGNVFRDAVTIYPLMQDGKLYWCGECGSFHLESETYYHDYELDVHGDSYEECVIKLAEKVKTIAGDKLTDDYCDIKGEIKIVGGVLNDDEWIVTWETEELLRLIKKFGGEDEFN